MHLWEPKTLHHISANIVADIEDIIVTIMSMPIKSCCSIVVAPCKFLAMSITPASFRVSHKSHRDLLGILNITRLESSFSAWIEQSEEIALWYKSIRTIWDTPAASDCLLLLDLRIPFSLTRVIRIISHLVPLSWLSEYTSRTALHLLALFCSKQNYPSPSHCAGHFLHF